MKTLMHIKLLRDDEGLQLELKSEVNFTSLFQSTGSPILIGGVRCYRPDAAVHWPANTVFGMNSTTAVIAGLFNHAEMAVNESPKINIFFLGAVDLKNGVLFNLGNRPVSADRLAYWKTTFGAAVKEIYRNYLKRVNVAVTITTSESEVMP